MEDNFNKHLGNKLKLRRLALGLTQTKVAKAINVTFQQIQKYEKGTNGVSSIRLLQLANYLKVPVNYFFEDFSEYLINLERSNENHMTQQHDGARRGGHHRSQQPERTPGQWCSDAGGSRRRGGGSTPPCEAHSRGP